MKLNLIALLLVFYLSSCDQKKDVVFFPPSNEIKVTNLTRGHGISQSYEKKDEFKLSGFHQKGNPVLKLRPKKKPKFKRVLR